VSPLETERRPGPGAERRRQLRLQRRNQRLQEIWRVLVLVGASAGLGWVLLGQGWSLRSPSQVEVVGSRQVSRDQIIQEARLRFPVQLLNLQPRQLAAQLAAALPVENVQVTRLMLPPRLRIDLVDRKAVARAERHTGKGLEQGYVDRLGNWMTSRQQSGANGTGGAPLLLVSGWQEHLRPPLAQVLGRSGQLGSTLVEIQFEPNGNLWLITSSLGKVRLGLPDGQLGRRLEMLSHLSSQLSSRVKGLKVQSIDLSDPDHPELGLPPKPRPGGPVGSGPGVD